MWSDVGCFLCTSRHSKGESGAGIMSNLWHAGRMSSPRMYQRLLVNEFRMLRERESGKFDSTDLELVLLAVKVRH